MSDADKIRFSIEGLPQYKSDGEKANADFVIQEAKEKQAEAAVQATDVVREMGISKLPFDFTKMQLDGVDLKQQLPNKYTIPLTTPVTGIDLSTGKQWFKAVREDSAFETSENQRLMGEARKRLNDSYTMPGKLPPPEDVTALAIMARPFIRKGASVEDFMNALPIQYTDKHVQLAWNSEMRAHYAEKLSRNLRFTQDPPAPPPEFEFQQTRASKEFASYARTISKSLDGREFAGTDLEAADFLIRWLRGSTDNLVLKGIRIHHMMGADGKTLEAYDKAAEMFDRTAPEGVIASTLASLGNMATDPTNLLGLGVATKGVGAIALLAKRFLAGAPFGAAAGVADEVMRNLPSEEQLSAKRTATAAAWGSVGTGVANATIPIIGTAAIKTLAPVWSVIKKHADAYKPGTFGTGLGGMGDGGGKPPPVPPAVQEAIDLVPRDAKSGFYSPLHRAVAALPDKRMTFTEAKALIKKNSKDVKLSEENWVDFEGTFKDQKFVTKQELMEHVEAHRLPVTIKAETSSALSPELQAKLNQYNDDVDYAVNLERQLIASVLTYEGEARKRVENQRREATAVADFQRTQRRAWAAANGIHIDNFGNVKQPPFATYTAGGWGKNPASNYGITSLVDTLSDAQSHEYHKRWLGTIGWALHTDRPAGPGALSYVTPSKIKVSFIASDGAESMTSVTGGSDGYFLNGELHGVKVTPESPARYTENLRRVASQLLDAGADPDAMLHTKQGIRKGKLRALAPESVKAEQTETTLHTEENQSDVVQALSMNMRAFAEQQANGEMPATLSYEQARWDAYLKYLGGYEPATIVKSGEHGAVVHFGGKASTFDSMEEALAFADRVDAKAKAAAASNPSGKPVNVDDASRQQINEMLYDKDFWHDPTIAYDPDQAPFFFAPVVALGDRGRHNVHKAMLFKAVLADKDWYTWSSSDVIRDKYYGHGWKASEVVVEPDGNIRGIPKKTSLETEDSDRFASPAALLIDLLQKRGKHDQADAVQMAYDQAHQAGRSKKIKFGEEIELVRAKFGEYDNKDRTEMDAFLKKYGVKVERVNVGRGAGESWGVRLTPELKKKLLQDGIPLALHQNEETANA